MAHGLRLHHNEKYFIFGKGGGAVLAHELNTKLLATIPLVAEVGEAADKGLGVFEKDNEVVSLAFKVLADEVLLF